MPAWIPAVVAAGASLLGSMSQSSAARAQARAQVEAAEIAAAVARETNDINRAIAMENLAQQWRMFEQQLAFNIEARDAERYGGEDAAGNRTYWMPGRGWVVDLEPRSDQILSARLRQEILDRTERDRMVREQEGRQESLQRDEFRQAGSELDALRNTRRIPANALADLLFGQGEQGRAEARDDIAQQLIRTQMRQGNTSNIPEVFSRMAGQSGRDAQTARIDATLKGIYDSSNLYSSERANIGNLQSLFSNNAKRPFGAPPSSAGGASITAFSPQIGGTNAGNINAAFSRGTPQQPYESPDFSAANLALARGSAGMTSANAQAGLFDAIGGLALAIPWNRTSNPFAYNSSTPYSSMGMFGTGAWGDADRTSGNSFGAGDAYAWT